jgi:orotate phosphoribosyltransferase
VLELIKELGGEAVGIAVIGDRSGGTWSGSRLESLISFETIEYDPDACPLCKEGKPFDAPGSRHLK